MSTCHFRSEEYKHPQLQSATRALPVDFEAGVSQGCRTCKLMRLAIESWSKYRDVKYVEHVTSLNAYAADDFIDVIVGLSEGEEVHLRFQEESCVPKRSPKANGDRKSHLLENQQRRRHQAGVWLNRCLQEHVACNIRRDTFRPKRLLELDITQGKARLIAGLKPDENTSYACLSHCWGGAVPICTVKENLEARCSHGISFDDLPLNFRDAVEVCSFLGLGYLWIDSLCIVQDDDDDWLEQARQMAAIYESSLVTIAAAAASTCHDGFLAGARGGDVIRVYDEEGNSGSMVHKLQHHEWAYSSPKSFFLPTQMPLSRRAWALQEYLLSPRSLLFGSDEMAWECREAFACECDERHKQMRADDHADYRGKVQFRSGLCAPPPHRPHVPDSFHAAWVKLMANYMTRNISFERDRLVALAGIIDSVAAATGLTCHAGHWNRSFLEGLAWYSSSSRRSTLYRAPSWSWTSMEPQSGCFGVCEGYPFDPDSTYAAEVISIDCPALGFVEENGSSNGGDDGGHDDDDDNNDDGGGHPTLVLDAWVWPRSEWQSYAQRPWYDDEHCDDGQDDLSSIYGVVLGTPRDEAIAVSALLCRVDSAGRLRRIGIIYFKIPGDIEIATFATRRRVELM